MTCALPTDAELVVLESALLPVPPAAAQVLEGFSKFSVVARRRLKTRLRRSNAAGLIGRITLPGLANGAVPNTAALSILGETLKNS